MEHDFTKYLSDAAMDELSLALKSDDDETKKTAFILKDGTTILVESVRNKEEEKFMLENPYDIKVSCRSMLYITYKDKDGYEGSTWIKAKSPEDLRNKWIAFCKEHDLEESVVGTIEAITYTSEQSIVKNRLLKHLNDFVNTITDTDVDIFKYSDYNDGSTIPGIITVDDEIKERYDMLYTIIGAVTGLMLNSGMASKLHIPSTLISADFLSKNPKQLRATEIKEYFYRGDNGNFSISPCRRVDDDNDEDFDDEDYYDE